MKPFRLLLSLLLLCCLTVPALAASGDVVEIACPVCQTKISATAIFSSNTFGGADPDLMERSRGGYPYILRPVTCPSCLLSVWSVEAIEEEEIRPELREALLRKPSPFVIPAHSSITANSPSRAFFTEGLDSEQKFPAWVRYDLMMQQAEFLQEPAEVRLTMAQYAAWSVRIEENPFTAEVSKLSREELKPLVALLSNSTPTENDAESEIDAARKLLENSELTANQALFAAFLLRSHGEITDLERAQEKLAHSLARPELMEQLSASIALERKYLALQPALFDQLLAAPPEEMQAGIFHYLKGEAYRRLGETEKARAAYQTASNMKLPEWLTKWAKSQPALLQN